MRKVKIYFRMIFATMLIISGCVKPFDYSEVTYEEILVVDGLITNENKKHPIRLTKTAQITEPAYNFVTNASVFVETSSGDIQYEEVAGSPGLYEPVNSFQGIAGVSYTLHISLINGNSYVSTPELMSSITEIDSIYSRYAEVVEDGSNTSEGGIQFFIDSHDDSGNNRYFRYEWEETYKIQVPYPSNYDYDPVTKNYFYRTQQVGVCYNTIKNQQLLVGNSLNNSFNRISEYPIRFVSGESHKLRTRYSLLVKQYAITKESYLYYSKLKESNETGGFLFDKQQGSITGNIQNESNSSEPVLGHFEVSSVAEKRRFYNLRDLDGAIGYPSFKFFCDSNEIIETTNDSIPLYMDRRSYLRIINIEGLGNPARLMSKECTDCSWYASTTKPEFWID